jgi:DNA topoisomerase-1
VLPPGWLEVRVNPRSGGRIQAIGIDRLGRLQYRYHPDFTARRERLKYSKLERFGRCLPALREQMNADLSRRGLKRERVIAAMIRLMNDLYIRLGSDESARRYRTFGVTTLLNRHVSIDSRGVLEFNYVGKHHIRRRQILVDPPMARLLEKLKAVGGARLFNALDGEGRAHRLRPADVNRYIKSVMGQQYSAKDFRTWHGTLLAAEELAAIGPTEGKTRAKKAIVEAVKRVSEQLGNTPSVCRKCYIHPAVIESYEKGITLEAFKRSGKRVVPLLQQGYEPEEVALMELLRSANR